MRSSDAIDGANAGSIIIATNATEAESASVLLLMCQPSPYEPVPACFPDAPGGLAMKPASSPRPSPIVPPNQVPPI